jgi:hypothetical protein
MVGWINGTESTVYRTYTDLEAANKYLEMNRKLGEFEEFEILENELEGDHEIVYRVIGFDGGSCIDLLGICDTLDNAYKLITEKHEELEKNNIHYPYYDVEEIDL